MTPSRTYVIEGDFARDGAVCVRDAFTADDIALAAEAIEAVLADPSPRAKRASAPDDGAFVEDFNAGARFNNQVGCSTTLTEMSTRPGSSVGTGLTSTWLK